MLIEFFTLRPFTFEGFEAPFAEGSRDAAPLFLRHIWHEKLGTFCLKVRQHILFTRCCYSVALPAVPLPNDTFNDEANCIS